MNLTCPLDIKGYLKLKLPLLKVITEEVSTLCVLSVLSIIQLKMFKIWTVGS